MSKALKTKERIKTIKIQLDIARNYASAMAEQYDELLAISTPAGWDKLQESTNNMYELVVLIDEARNHLKNNIIK